MLTKTLAVKHRVITVRDEGFIVITAANLPVVFGPLSTGAIQSNRRQHQSWDTGADDRCMPKMHMVQVWHCRYHQRDVHDLLYSHQRVRQRKPWRVWHASQGCQDAVFMCNSLLKSWSRSEAELARVHSNSARLTCILALCNARASRYWLQGSSCAAGFGARHARALILLASV